MSDLLSSISPEACIVALLMTGLIRLRMITKVHGSIRIPGRIRSRKKLVIHFGGQKSPGSRHCWKQDLIAEKKSMCEHT